MLRIYSIPIGNDNSVINAQSDIIYDLLTFGIPWKFGLIECNMTTGVTTC